MVENKSKPTYTSFLGTGWSFPPEFVQETGEVVMVADEEDIATSLKILFGTAIGERLFNPKYGLDMQGMLFEPMSTTMETFLIDQIKTTILIYEPRINLLSLRLDTSNQYDGKISIIIDYEIRAANSRFNLVYPFYTDEMRQMVDSNIP